MTSNAKYRKWLGHTLSIIPFIPTLEDTFPELAKKLRLSNYFSNGKVFAGASTTYHTLERFVDREIVQLVMDAAGVVPGFRVSGFCPFLKVADLDVEVSAEMPNRWVLDEDGNDTAVALTWREWCLSTSNRCLRSVMVSSTSAQMLQAMCSTIILTQTAL